MKKAAEGGRGRQRATKSPLEWRRPAKERIGPIIRKLKRQYPDAKCALDHENPLQLLVATILSAQCTDVRVNLVTKDLFRKYRTAQDFAAADPERLQEEIKSTGFFRNKTKSLIGMGKALVERHHGEVPRTMAELTQVPGAGGRRRMSCWATRSG